jgi:hypothetical protein
MIGWIKTAHIKEIELCIAAIDTAMVEGKI